MIPALSACPPASRARPAPQPDTTHATMTRILFAVTVFLALSPSLRAQSTTTTTPQSCPGSYSASWSQCVGSFETAEGNRYEGHFQQGRPHGYGVFFYLADGPTQGDVYSGQWENGQMTGVGTYFFSYGALYSGQYRNGLYHGLGLFYYSNGDLYRGMFLKGTPHGQGRLLQSGKTFEGEFVSGVLSGGQLTVIPDRNPVINLATPSAPKASPAATTTTAPATLATAPSSSTPASPSTPETKRAPEVREADKPAAAKAASSKEKKKVAKKLPACKGRQSAKWTACVGKIKFASSGVEYEGEFLEGRPHGKGRSKLPNGDIYVGEYLNGKRHGQGEMRSATDGSLRKGLWENGEFVSE